MHENAYREPNPMSSDTSINQKRCRQCGRSKPIREFELPRHRLCIHCRTRGVVRTTPEQRLEAEQRAQREYALMKAAERDAARARGENPWQPPDKPPPRTMDWDSFKNYQVDYKRQRRNEREALAREAGHDVPAPRYREIKVCVRCKARKHVTHFREPRDRICIACFDPINLNTT